jgi:hypothetical protein
MKQWKTVLRHKGRDIQILDGVGAGDCLDYRVSPPLSGQNTFLTIGDAVAAIDREAGT